MTAKVLQFPNRQRGHMHTGWAMLLGWASIIVGMVITGGGLYVLWVGLRMALRG